jgi:hypothetical protein
MGVVYEARQVRADRLVALKMIRGRGEPAEAARQRFLTEARAVARLNHPNIVQVYETGAWDGQPYFAMEYVPGGSLADRLRDGPLSPGQAARLVETLARAVEAAHREGVIHRDLKPHNVLLMPETRMSPSPSLGAPKVSDFGLARLLDESDNPTRTGAVLGTPAYMAPEQAAGRVREVGPAADVYALGAILYEALTGKPPFRAATPLATLEQVRTQPPVPPRRWRPDCPPALEAVCLCCLEKDARHRYSSAGELAEDLSRFLDGKPTRARPLPLWRRLLGCKFLPALLAAPLLYWIRARPGELLPEFLLLLVLASYFFLQRRQQARPPVLSEPLPWDETAPVAPVRQGRRGWVTLPLARLRFPAVCSACGRPAGSTMPLRLSNRSHRMELVVPVCASCQTDSLRRRRWGLCCGLGVGVLVMSVLAIPYARYHDLRHHELLVFLFVASAALGGAAGSVVGLLLTQRPPVRWRRYSWKRGTVDLRFRRAEYADQVVAALDRQAKPVKG